MSEPKPGTWEACFKTATDRDVLSLVRMLRTAQDGWSKSVADCEELRAMHVADAQTIAEKQAAINALEAECSHRRMARESMILKLGELECALAKKEKRK